MTSSQRLYRIRDAAELLAIGRTRLYELIAAGELLAVSIGERDRGLRIPAAEIDRFVEERLEAARTKAAQRAEVATVERLAS